ncbi:hypothetical protein J010_05192 [Cryptococcus neoformans]|nr:hypothetical protein C355_05233 [Cryptococcus neoformans var. grubii Th84]OXH04797.1 hypothetical protein J010_05192 [Cryptococcus neoformans var. grubii]OXH26567.1 hypothetical protein J009_05191 [Cryptococcus neoformans var. grubii]OXH46348.1 hypothetical protein J004_05245 [Cryptococcus neoformans var. grubii]OXH47310.1 hypothetical protein J003_05140 [Cryptococcus neoformans var. grubii]
MFSPTSSLFVASMALALPATAGTIFTKSNAAMTFYYDISEGTSDSEVCGSSADDPVQYGWATSSGINGGVPYCERSRGYSLKGIGTNNIVAFNSALVAANPARWCGREVKIYKADGNEFTYSGGSLYIWDGCDACSSSDSGILDLSAPTFVELKGGTCTGNNPTGLTYEVLYNYIVNPSVGLGSGYSEEAASDDIGAGFTTAAVYSSAEAVTSASHAIVTSAQPEVVTSSQQAATTAAVLSLQYSYSSVVQGTDINAFSTDDIVLAAVETDVNSARSSTSDTVETSAAATSTGTVCGGSTCAFGAWQCSGLELQICNYLTVNSLGWETIETCGATCLITNSGSVDCE